VVVFAHGIVGRADLPIPVSGFIIAAAAVLVISFVGLAGGWSQPRLEQWRERRVLPLPRAAEVLLGALGFFVFVVCVYAGLAGSDSGDGSNFLGGAGKGIDYSILTATAIWYVQVGALVLGHVAGLVLSHDRALTVYGSQKDAVASQVVMLVVMVIFTILGVWLLSAALNT
jgi:hypothetical protein